MPGYDEESLSAYNINNNRTGMKLYIKYMVSPRCKQIVKEELRKLDLQYGIVDLGTVEILDGITHEQREQLTEALQRSGFELLDEEKSKLIERIINVIIEMVHYADELPKDKPEYISNKLNCDFTYLFDLFLEVKSITIDQFIKVHKIERVKELLLYDELSLKEISDKLNYSSVPSLAHQFKKATGLTPSFYKKLKQKRRDNLKSA